MGKYTAILLAVVLLALARPAHAAEPIGAHTRQVVLTSVVAETEGLYLVAFADGATALLSPASVDYSADPALGLASVGGGSVVDQEGRVYRILVWREPKPNAERN